MQGAIEGAHMDRATWASTPAADDPHTGSVTSSTTPKATTARQRFTQEFTKCLLVDNMLEDLATVEGTQRGLASRAVKAFPLQDKEILIRHNLKVVDTFVQAAR